MSKQSKISIGRDGKIQAEAMGVEGKKCTDYIMVLEEILEAVAVDSSFTPEAYEPERLEEATQQKRKLGEGTCG
jgi:hypothetical protein